ncbi:MAG: hypothetical protein AB7O56_09640 [Bauldia sp.]
MHRISTVAIAFIAALIASPAVADPIYLTTFGHLLEIRQTDAGEELRLDGTAVHQSDGIFLDSVGIVAGMPVIVGRSATRTDCPVAPWVIFFPPDGDILLEGPVDSCVGLETLFRDDRLLFRSSASATAPGQTFSWTPTGGFEREADLVFIPGTAEGWMAANRHAIGAPSDLLGHGDTRATVDAIVGMAAKVVVPILQGPGNGEYRGDFYVGTACLPSDCSAGRALIVADIIGQEVFVAWRSDGPETLLPAETEWPAVALDALAEWRTAP